MDAWYNWGWKARMEKDNPEGAQIVGKQQEYLYYDLLQQTAAPINNIWHATYIGPMWSRVGTLNLKKGDTSVY